jgi:hypothetical protein
MEQNINTLSHLSKELQLRRSKSSSVLDWAQSPLLSWLLPLLAPLILIFILLNFLPCIIRTLQNFLLDCLSAATNQRLNQLLLQGYQPLHGHWRDLYNGPYQDTRLWGSHLRTYYVPCQQEVARWPKFHPSTQPFSTSKQKMGEW